MGGDDRKRDRRRDRARCRRCCARASTKGACGLSTGLIYPPCCYADTDELIALGRVLAETGRPLVVHMRSESDRILEALDEMIRVARESGCAGAHLAPEGRGPRQLGRARATWSRRSTRAARRGCASPPTSTPTSRAARCWARSSRPGRTPAAPRPRCARLPTPRRGRGCAREMADPAPADWDNFWKWSGPGGDRHRRHPLRPPSRVAGQEPGRGGARPGARTRSRPPSTCCCEERMGVAMISFSQDEAVVERFLAPALRRTSARTACSAAARTRAPTAPIRASSAATCASARC